MTSGQASVASPQDIRTAQREFLFPCVAPLYQEPLVLAEAEGVWATDREGRRFLDLFGGILTTSIGHCHPQVVEAISGQLGVLGHTSTLYLTQNQVGVAEQLARLAPGDLSCSFFTNSGTEAIETAVMLACLYTGNSEIIALRHSYSGRSVLSTNLTGHSSWRPLAASFPGIQHVMSPYPYRCPFHNPCDESCLDAYARDLEDVIQSTTNGRPAAFLAETIQGVGGYVVPPQGYFQRAAEIIRGYGGLFICDEVQTGFGRTGDKWFGIEHWGVVPDIMVMAKGIANGMPVGATITRPEIAKAWTAKTISTFGGNPVSMAGAKATLEVMVREDTPARSAARGLRLREGLMRLAQRYSWIGEVRGMGLMQALELVVDPATKEPAPQTAQALLEATKKEELLIGLGGRSGHVVRLGPSMLITEEELDEGVDRLGRACAQVEAG